MIWDLSPEAVLRQFNRVASFATFREPEATLDSKMTDLGLDSLDRVELLMELEEYYECEFDDEELDNCKTVGDFVNLVIQRKIK